MAPTKRQRQIDDGETVEILESASSNLQRDSRKRMRVAAPLQTVEPDLPFASTQARTFREEIEELTEKLEAEPSDDEAGVQHATQAIARNKRNLPEENRPMDCGVIESITCVNFMCHQKLHVALGPLINFIIGHNGSGKSAILSGITLALGGKATSTNRGQSLKNFVKHGEETASLAVKIKNKGDLAYKTDIYGDSITVERHFSISGASSFKLKNQEGKLISNKRSELDEIVDFYAFQLDNPVNVLTQDMARQFLNSSSPAEKYKFFLRGVQLEQLDLDYSLVGDSLDRAEARQEAVNEDCKVHEERARLALQKLDASKRQDTIREKIAELARQFAWTQVEDEEKALEDLQNKLADFDTRIREKNDIVKSEEVEFDSAGKLLQDTELACNEMQTELVAAEDEANVAQSHANSVDAEVQEILALQREIGQGVKTSTDKVANLQRNIEAEKQKLADADGGRTAQLYELLEAAEEKVKEIQNSQKDLHLNQPTLDRDHIAAEARVREAKDVRDRKSNEVATAEETLRSLTGSESDRMNGFPAKMQQLVNAVAKETGFIGHRPTGPIGRHVTLTKPEWSKILEKSFGSTLNAFCVTRKEDQSLLTRLMGRINFSVPIYIVNDEPMDTTPHEADPQFDTILRALQFDNTLVRNALLMQSPIEKTILVPQQDEATKIMYPNNARGPRPKNIAACFSFNSSGNDTSCGVRFAYGAGSAPKMEPAQGWTALGRMRTDNEAQIRLEQEHVSNLKSELEQLTRKHRALTEETQKCLHAKNKNVKDMAELKKRLAHAKADAQDCKDRFEDSKPGEGTLDSQRELLKEAEGDLDMIERQATEADNTRDEKVEEYNKAEQELKDCLSRAVSVKNKRDKMIDKVKIHKDQREAKMRRKNEAHAAVRFIIQEKEEHEKSIAEQEKTLEDFIYKASQVSERVPVEPNQTADTLHERLEVMQRKRAELERQTGGSREELTRAAAEAKTTWDRARKQQNELNLLIKTLKRSLFHRHKRWFKFRNHICVRARAEFMMLLANRQFRGKMMIDHRTKLLDLQVEPDSTRRSGDGRQTKTLSGGEKSFSTICMLLALWNAMGSPIRCLDEFDVFMDSVNRDISTRMMIAAARESVGRQFILITPQAMGNVTMASDVKVIRLQDPERGQTTLNFPEA